MTARNHEQTYRPLLGGIAVLNPLNGHPGTLGVIGTSDGHDRWMISCYRVLGRLDLGPFADGEAILQSMPSRIGSPVARAAVARADAALDCAAARIDPGILCSPHVLGLPPVTGVEQAVVGMRVMKSGFTTGVTEGIVVRLQGNQVEIRPDGSCQGEYDLVGYGDAGALWINPATGGAVALNRDGNAFGRERAAGLDFATVLRALDLHLWGGP